MIPQLIDFTDTTIVDMFKDETKSYLFKHVDKNSVALKINKKWWDKNFAFFKIPDLYKSSKSVNYVYFNNGRLGATMIKNYDVISEVGGDYIYMLVPNERPVTTSKITITELPF